MTFSVVQVDHCIRKVVGRIWASDEATAQAMAPAIVQSNNLGVYSIERFEECEIPLKLNEDFRRPGH